MTVEYARERILELLAVGERQSLHHLEMNVGVNAGVLMQAIGDLVRTGTVRANGTEYVLAEA